MPLSHSLPIASPRAAVWLALLIGALLAVQPRVAHAQGDTPVAPATEIPAVPQREADDSEKDRLETLKRQHDELEFKKRTNAPFSSERSLRHELRRNEAQQGWEKSEQRRLEYEQLRQQRDSRNR